MIVGWHTITSKKIAMDRTYYAVRFIFVSSVLCVLTPQLLSEGLPSPCAPWSEKRLGRWKSAAVVQTSASSSASTASDRGYDRLMTGLQPADIDSNVRGGRRRRGRTASRYISMVSGRPASTTICDWLLKSQCPSLITSDVIILTRRKRRGINGRGRRLRCSLQLYSLAATSAVNIVIIIF